MKILNLGCGTKTSDNPDVINIDWSIYLRLSKNPFLRRLAPVIFRGERLQRFNTLPDNILVRNLKKGIPFKDASVDAVFHSHMLEHLDRSAAPVFMRDVFRVLIPGGIHRMVVPDLEKSCRAYVAHLEHCDNNPAEQHRHDDVVADMIEQMVRREAFGSSRQKLLRRFIENLLLGDARRRGETHQWMYDRVNLSRLLSETGFDSISIGQFNSSAIPHWEQIGLEVDAAGHECKPNSLYMEAIKPIP